MQKKSSIRGQVFKEELNTLKEKKYIDEHDFNKIKDAYNLYLHDLDQQKHKSIVQNHITVRERPQSDAMENTAPIVNQPQKPITKKMPTPVKPKKILTPEKIRERNISWLLILGVIMLFIGGLVFGTSNWASMGNLFKVLLVSLVSIVFFASSHIAEKYLHINKTAFAFMTLGSLFVPITFISIGFFQLLGYWLSFYGEGRYVLGFIGSIVCFPLYAYIAKKYKHRLFVWFTYLSATIGVGFLLAMTYLPRDFFYLGIMLYNALLLFGYFKYKNRQNLALFIKELPVYSQLNLIVSTLLMLFFYENATFYSFNILLTAALYISMVFVNKTKHYHYVFTLLFVYGMYQLITNSFLESINYAGFAMIGLLYLVFQQYAAKEAYIQKMFQLTSGIISFFAFIYISIQGILLRSDGDSLVLLFAYIIIAVNYIYLSNIAKHQIFKYLAPVFLMAAGLQSYFALFKGIPENFVQLYMFAMAAIMYIVLYLKNRNKYFASIKTSSFYVSVGTMLLTILYAVGSEELTNASIQFFALGILALLTIKNTEDGKYNKIAAWVNPVSWGLSFISFYHYLEGHIPFYGNNLRITAHLAICGLLLLAISYFWRSRKQQSLDLNTFLTAQAVYTLSILTSSIELIDHPTLAASIYFVGIIIYLLLVYRMKLEWMWIFVSVTSGIFLSSLTAVFKLQNHYTLLAVYSLLIPVLLLMVYEFIGRKVPELKLYFFWTAHVMLANIFLFDAIFIFYEKLQPELLIIALGAYIYSTLKQKMEWEIKLFLYASFTALPVLLELTIIHYKLGNIFTGDYLFPIVTWLIAVLWLSVNETWKERIVWYLIPQSILGLLIFIGYIDGPNIIQLIIFILYGIMTLFFLHRRKLQLYTVIPLFLAVVFFVNYLFYMEKLLQIGLVLALYVALHLFGRFFYKKLIERTEKTLQIDWYTIASLVSIIMLFGFISGRDPLWMKLIPSLLVVYSLYSLINRFTTIFEKRIIKTLTAVSILLPYYTTIREITINQYIVTELYTLPLIGITIFLSRHTWKDYKKIMNTIQLTVLLIVTYILVADALHSNTIYDAIIIGVLSLASILGGMHYRIKSYFFVGIIVLLLNIFLQTKPYWGNFPWWGYLIVGGITLISFASFYEFQKQKKDTDRKSFFTVKKEQFLKKFKDWD